jgi:hypothetical protein
LQVTCAPNIRSVEDVVAVNLHLDDVDLGNRRIVVADRIRPLDDHTHQALRDRLE